MKKIYRAMAGFFLAALLAVGLASLFTTGSGTDGASTKKPEFSMQALLDGTFISQLETYYANTFPMRDITIRLPGTTTSSFLAATPAPSRAASRWRGRSTRKPGRHLKMSRHPRRRAPAMRIFRVM